MKRNTWQGSAMMRLVMPAALALAGTAGAQEAADDGNAIEAKIRALAPNAETIAISETPIDNLLQVQINSEIYYATSDAKYLISGRVIDLDTRTDITDQARSGIRKAYLDGLDPAEQISFSPAEPDFELLVFTDIDCGYCRKLHDQIDDYMAEGIAIHYLAFPRAGVGSHSFDKYVSVWCAADKQVALTDAKSGTDPEPLKCDNPIEGQYQLGRELGVTGTPALLTSDGTLIPGYVPPAQLRERLELIAAETTATP